MAINKMNCLWFWSLLLSVTLANLPLQVLCQNDTDTTPYGSNTIVAAVLGTFFSTIVVVLIIILIVYLVHRQKQTKSANLDINQQDNDYHSAEQAITSKSHSEKAKELMRLGSELTPAVCAQNGYSGYVMCREYAQLSVSETERGASNEAYQL